MNKLYLFLFVCLACLAGLAGQVKAQNVEVLAEKIRAGTSEEKRDALFEIRNLQKAEFSRLAVPALKDADEIVRATAAFAVVFLPPDEAFTALLPNLADTGEIVRRETAYALGKVQNPQAVTPLLNTFQKDKSAEVKNACLIALGEIGDVSAVESLTQILRARIKSDDDFLRRSAARSLGQIAQMTQIKQSLAVTPENFLPEKYKSVALEKYRDLSLELAPFRSAVDVLMKVLQNPKESADTRRESAYALGAIAAETAVSALEMNLNNPDYYLAEICKESLKKISNREKELKADN